MFDYLVVGKGLMGSAAARHLSRSGASVAIIGPDEPTQVADHEGVFASHYDQGRITRLLSRDLVWAELAHRAIEQYATLEAESGITFYYNRGCLYVATADADDKYAPHVQAISQQYPVEYERLNNQEADTIFPFFQFPADCTFFFETIPAGYINPRELIRAQVAIAQKQGAMVLRETAVSLTPHTTHIAVTTKEGHSYQGRQALLAMGAYANCFGLLPRPLDLHVETETIVLAEIAEAEVDRLQKMPAVIYQTSSGHVPGFYMLPPIQYPGGRFYIKMGCDTIADKRLHNYDEIQAWMRYGDSEAALPEMQTAMLGMLPGLTVQSWQTKRCLLTYTSHKKPTIGAVDKSGRLFVVTGGNGTSAKSSDAIGHLAAKLMLQGTWQDSLAPELFQVSFVS